MGSLVFAAQYQPILAEFSHLSLVLYADGDEEILNVRKEHWELVGHTTLPDPGQGIDLPNPDALSVIILDYELLDLEIPTISIVRKLIEAGIPVLVFSGDQDSVIPLTGSRTLVHGLAEELGLNTTVPYRVWFGQANIRSFANSSSAPVNFSAPSTAALMAAMFTKFAKSVGKGSYKGDQR
ncbi:hypothetical protein F0562_025899 [Nyssa sinensis]|uniref:Uncharacterized protein n=1 Tax=Nyssa sinensis TaxID=561372 RepID=A0A5J5BBX5_9ASTE|nr:hypothetical protein F0562_025899 [Nyssa sinensis]